MSDAVHLHGDACAMLRTLPAQSVQCCITSPPYWGLRDYGTPPQVWGGDPACPQWHGHLGLEPTPEAYVAHLVAVFREVGRVLRDDGTLWLNLGDSYAANNWVGNRADETSGLNCIKPGYVPPYHSGVLNQRNRKKTIPSGLKQKDLVGIPWRVALALQADGWYLRSDIIWAKGVSGQKELLDQLRHALRKSGLTVDQITRTMAHLEPYVGNCMPESVRDRPTRAHEYLFLLTKRAKYYYDAQAIMEAGVAPLRVRADRFGGNKHNATKHSDQSIWLGGATRNRRSVWLVPTQPYKKAHFATFPERLIEPCVLAGSRPGDTGTGPLRRQRGDSGRGRAPRPEGDPDRLEP